MLLRNSQLRWGMLVRNSSGRGPMVVRNDSLAGMAVKGLFDRLDRGIDLKRYLRETGRAFLQRRELIVAPPGYLKPRADPTLSLLQMSQGDLTSPEKRRLGRPGDATRPEGDRFAFSTTIRDPSSLHQLTPPLLAARS